MVSYPIRGSRGTPPSIVPLSAEVIYHMVGNYPCFFDDRLWRKRPFTVFFRLSLSASRYAPIFGRPRYYESQVAIHSFIFFFFHFGRDTFAATTGDKKDSIFLGEAGDEGGKELQKLVRTLDLSLD